LPIGKEIFQINFINVNQTKNFGSGFGSRKFMAIDFHLKFRI